MISPECFFPELAILLTVKGNLVWPGEIQARFYESLAPLMDDTQFRAACAAAMASERFMPTPVRLLELAQGDFKAQAEEAWHAISVRYAQNVSPLTDDGTESRAVMALIGATTERIAKADFMTWDVMGRRFREVFSARMLANATAKVLEASGHQALEAPGQKRPELPSPSVVLAMATVDAPAPKRVRAGMPKLPQLDGPGGAFLASYAERQKTKAKTSDELIRDLARAQKTR